jgi:nucleoside-diphosphate-sugar epimerase/predicted dehydrogenase
LTRAALLGAGYIADAHARALAAMPDVTIAAVCDTNLSRARALAEQFGVNKVFTQIEGLLTPDVDIIHILLPPALHVDAARQCIDAGKHVFIEKPMGLAPADCQSLTDAAQARGVRLGVNHNFLFLPSYERLRRDVRAGVIGRIGQLSVRWFYPLAPIKAGPFDSWMMRDARNLVFELGPHLVAFVIDLLGPLENVTSSVSDPVTLPTGVRLFRRWHIAAESAGAAVHLAIDVGEGAVERSLTVRGPGAIAVCDFERDTYAIDEPGGTNPLFADMAFAGRRAGQTMLEAGSSFVRRAASTVRKRPAASVFGESMQRAIAAFYAGIDTTPDSRMTGEFGTRVIEACDAVVEAARLPTVEVAPPAVLKPPARPTILVIGGTGFIGRHLVKRLAEKGHSVRVVTRSAGNGAALLAGLPVELAVGDAANTDYLDRALQGIEVVYDLAKANGRNWSDYVQNDIEVTRRIGERALAAGVRRLIYTGTISSYYSGDASKVIDGDTPLDPKIETRNLYARSKAASERVLLDLHREKGLPVVLFRPGIVIGPGSPPAHLGVADFQNPGRVRFFGRGDNKLPFVLVDDVVQGLVLGMDEPGLEGRAFLLSDEPLLSAREYVEETGKAMGLRFRATSRAIWRYYLADAFKEGVKHAIRHPNRRAVSYRDWAAQAQLARYDASETREALRWRPAGRRDLLVQRGIVDAVRAWQT